MPSISRNLVCTVAATVALAGLSAGPATAAPRTTTATPPKPACTKLVIEGSDHNGSLQPGGSETRVRVTCTPRDGRRVSTAWAFQPIARVTPHPRVMYPRRGIFLAVREMGASTVSVYVVQYGWAYTLTRDLNNETAAQTRVSDLKPFTQPK